MNDPVSVDPAETVPEQSGGRYLILIPGSAWIPAHLSLPLKPTGRPLFAGHFRSEPVNERKLPNPLTRCPLHRDTMDDEIL